MTPPVLSGAGQAARHGGSWIPRITCVPLHLNPAPRLFPPDGREVGAFLTPSVLGSAGQAARHGGSWIPRITCVPLHLNPAPRLFPPDGRKAGAFFDAAGSQRCGGRQPGMAGYERPVSPVYCPNRIQRSGSSLRTGGRPGRFWHCRFWRYGADSPAWRVMDTPHHPCALQPNPAPRFFLRTGGRPGRLFWGVALSRAGTFSRGAPQYVIYSPARQRAKTGSP